MNTSHQPIAESADRLAPVRSRLETLRFPPYFCAALSASPLGSLPDLWRRLGPAGRDDLIVFEETFRRGHRSEVRGDPASAAWVYRLLIKQFPHLSAIAEERLQALGQPLEEAAARVDRE